MVVGKTRYHKSKSKHNDSGSPSLYQMMHQKRKLKLTVNFCMRSKAGLLNLLKSTHINYLDFGSSNKKIREVLDSSHLDEAILHSEQAVP